MQNTAKGPRFQSHNRDENEIAREERALIFSTEQVEGKMLVRLKKRQIEPDANQPRRRKRKADVDRRRESMEHDGQQAAIEVYPLATTNRQGEPMYRISKGELRWLGTSDEGDLEAVINTDLLTPEQRETSQVIENVDHNDFDMAEICRIAWKFNKIYGKTYQQIADTLLSKYAKGREKWVADRAQVWGRISLDENFDAQGLPSLAIEKLLADHDDTFTHAQAIIQAPQEKWVHACDMVRLDGATVPMVKAYLHSEKKKAPGKQTLPSSSGGSGVTIHRSTAPNPTTPPPVSATPPPAPPPPELSAEEQAAILGSDWFENDERDYSAPVIQRSFDGAEFSLTSLVRDLPLALERADVTPLLLEAYKIRIGKLVELAATAQTFLDRQ